MFGHHDANVNNHLLSDSLVRFRCGKLLSLCNLIFELLDNRPMWLLLPVSMGLLLPKQTGFTTECTNQDGIDKKLIFVSLANAFPLSLTSTY